MGEVKNGFSMTIPLNMDKTAHISVYAQDEAQFKLWSGWLREALYSKLKQELEGNTNAED